MLGAMTVASAATRAPVPAFADGPAPCTAGGPPDPFHGFCATFSGRNTFYGSYGPGFPSTLGWGFCAENAATGGFYPVPSYNYTVGGAPPGADTSELDPLGFALSQAQANGWWTNGAGTVTADDFAAAGKLLYDNVVWGQAIPSMGPGMETAFADLDGWFQQAIGATGHPVLSIGVAGGGTTIDGSAFIEVHVQFPGSGAGVSGLGLLMAVTGGTFDSSTGSTAMGLSTNATGNAVVPVFAPSGSLTVTVDSAAGVGDVGIGFFHPANSTAQDLATVAAPTVVTGKLTLTQSPSPNATDTGTISIQKSVSDPAYYGAAGAEFDVSSGSSVVATLVTDSTGASPRSSELPPGEYTVTEVKAPAGYVPGPSQIVTVVAFENTVVYFTGAFENRVIPATVSIAKRDGHTGAPIDGAVFDVRYDSANNGTFNEDLGDCTTSGPTAICSPTGNDGTTLLPGDYEITEVQSPPGYGLNATDDTQTLDLTPGEHGNVTFDDYQGGLVIEKTGNDTNYASIVGAVFTVTGPLPATAVAGTLTVTTPDGATPELYPLPPGKYVVTESVPPAGYSAVTPITVTVGAGLPNPTVLDVLDPVQPASVSIQKIDAESGEPVAGAVFTVAFAPQAGGPYSEILGTCTTSPRGVCAPAGNDGPSALLPGDYQVTEESPPPGYVLPSSNVQDLVLSPGQVGEIMFEDQPLVSVSFQKVATGNVNPTQVVLAGAVIDVTSASPTGPAVASCTTDGTGWCSIPTLLAGGTRYCWREVDAPPGLAPGASGCFIASETDAAQPIVVSDPGLFVGVGVRKVDATEPTLGLAGAVFDLYRMDNGDGPNRLTPPSGAPTIAGGTWVARSVSGTDGTAVFPLQFPGFSYCVVEETPPTDFVSTSTPACTGILTGTVSAPAKVTILTMGDVNATVTLKAHKYNSLEPDTGIPGAVYDLYVEGTPPPGTAIATPPTPAPAAEPGDTWFARGTTGQVGTLTFAVPAGYAWCLKEVSAPLDYSLDPSLHCTSVLTTSSSTASTTVALPEVPATLYLSAQKFNAEQPDTVIPGATYELVVQGAMPPGFIAPSPPANAVIPNGDAYWGVGTSNTRGQLEFAIPAGHTWCLHELQAPPGYLPDPSFHCTTLLTTASSSQAMTVALPEQPTSYQIVAGGGVSDTLWRPSTIALVMMGFGAALVESSRRRRSRRASAGFVLRCAVSIVIGVGTAILGPIALHPADASIPSANGTSRSVSSRQTAISSQNPEPHTSAAFVSRSAGPSVPTPRNSPTVGSGSPSVPAPTTGQSPGTTIGTPALPPAGSTSDGPPASAANAGNGSTTLLPSLPLTPGSWGSSGAPAPLAGPLTCTPVVELSSGSTQETVSGSEFSGALEAMVTCGSVPAPGMTVRFELPPGGGDGSFVGGATIATAITDAAGIATSPMLVAGATTATWTATATLVTDKQGTWQPTTNLGQPPGNSTARFWGVACPSANSCVAVGSADGAAYVDSLENGEWTASSVPSPPGASSSTLHAVACPAVDSCVAVGTYSSSVGVTRKVEPMIELLNDGQWSLSSGATLGSTSPNAWLDGISCAVINVCEAVGGVDVGLRTTGLLTERLSGGTWSEAIAPSPSFGQPADVWPGGLHAVSCTGVTSCVAVGTYASPTTHQRQAPVITTLSTGNWTTTFPRDPVTVPTGKADAALLDVTCSTPDSCHAVGDALSATNSGTTITVTPLIGSLDGSTWSLSEENPTSNLPVVLLQGIACPGGKCITVGLSSSTSYLTLVQHHFVGEEAFVSVDTDGSWQNADVFDPTDGDSASLAAISCASVMSDCEAAGAFDPTDSTASLIESPWNAPPTISFRLTNEAATPAPSASATSQSPSPSTAASPRAVTPTDPTPAPPVDDPTPTQPILPSPQPPVAIDSGRATPPVNSPDVPLLPDALIVLGVLTAAGLVSKRRPRREGLEMPSCGMVQLRIAVFTAGALCLGGGFILQVATGPARSVPASAPLPKHTFFSVGSRQDVTHIRAPDLGPSDLSIPSLGISAPVIAVGITNDQLVVPSNVHVIGEWSGGATPRSSTGTVLLAGHVNWVGQGPGALSNLATIAPNAAVWLSTASAHTTGWTVQSVESVPKSELPQTIFASSGPHRLVLVTCGGPFDSTTGHYLDNVVVVASPMGP